MKAHGDLSRFSFQGPELELSSRTALAMALAVHELATNAIKYGALSQDTGQIAVTWLVTDGDFKFEWREGGGPVVAAPTQRGFGSRMIERALAGYFSGQAAIEYAPSGVVFRLECPVDALTED